VVASAGYKLARTTVAFRTSKTFDPYRMPVSLHFTHHRPLVHARHALKYLNLQGLTRWWTNWRLENDPVRLGPSMLEHVIQTNGILHIWGHSWELEAHRLWRPMEPLLREIAHQPGVRYLTNTDTLEAKTR